MLTSSNCVSPESLRFLVLALLFCTNCYPCSGSPQVPSSTVHFRNVRDFGAVGDGVHDDTNAFITAITQGRGQDPNAPYPNTIYPDSTIHACQIYVPAGTYLITGSLPLVYYTHIYGDISSLPTLVVVSTSAVSLRVLDALEPQWSTSVNQNNFYRIVRNIIVDMTRCAVCTGSHWQVAQATAMINVHFKMGPKNNQNQGIWMENGSGGYISDCSFDGGLFGLWVGNQQFTSRNLTITNAGTALYLNWDWNWSFKSLYISDCSVGVDVGVGTGSLVVLDSTFTNTPIAVRTGFSTTPTSLNADGAVSEEQADEVTVDKAVGTPPIIKNQLLIDLVKFVNCPAIVQNVINSVATTVLSSNSSTVLISQWAQGHVWNAGANTIQTLDLTQFAPKRPASLVNEDGTYFEKMRPTFDTFVDVSTLGVSNDGVADVTSALQSALLSHANNDALYFPHGIYRITDTVYVPPGSKIMGNAWSVFAASGVKFSDPLNPIPMFQVGHVGEVGVAQFIDVLFSHNGSVPGCVLLEWNMHDPAGAANRGSTGMWNAHFRVGGAVGTGIRSTNCLAGDGSQLNTKDCTGAYALMHVTQAASVYMENVWGWVADHDIDSGPQINVYNARGLLVQSRGPMWLYGTAFEHSALYQYNLNGASNILMAMIQTETPYYQPAPATTPFRQLITHPTDPNFCTDDIKCNMAYAVVIQNSDHIYTYGAGLYSFFNVWAQTCLKASPTNQPNCQINLVSVNNSASVYTYALSTYGSIYSLTRDQPYSFAESNLNTFCSTVIVDMNINTGVIPTQPPSQSPTTPTTQSPSSPTGPTATPTPTYAPIVTTANANSSQPTSSDTSTSMSKLDISLIALVIVLAVLLIAVLVFQFRNNHAARASAQSKHSRHEPLLNEMTND